MVLTPNYNLQIQLQTYRKIIKNNLDFALY